MESKGILSRGLRGKITDRQSVVPGWEYDVVSVHSIPHAAVGSVETRMILLRTHEVPLSKGYEG
jgi:hypothetical protein